MTRIVVIDDRVTNRNILTRLALSVEEGLQVSAYASPVEALDALDGGLECDLIVTDFNMPEMDGAAFVRTLRQRSERHDVPVVVVTVYEDREFCYRALEAGATDFLLSPVDHLEFRARARNLLTLRRQQRLLADRAAGLEQALTRQETASGEDLLGRVLDAIPAAISIVDGQGRLVFANQAHAALLGLPRQEALGRPLAETHGEDYALRSGVRDEKVRETGVPLVAPALRDGRARRQPALPPDRQGPARQRVGLGHPGAERRVRRHRAAAGGGRQRALGPPRSPDRPAERHLVPGPRRGGAAARAPGARESRRCCTSTSTASRASTTPSARSSATACSRRWPGACATGSRTATCWPGCRATSSPSCAPASSARTTRPSWRGGSPTRSAEPFLVLGHEVNSSASVGITLAPADGRTADGCCATPSSRPTGSRPRGATTTASSPPR